LRLTMILMSLAGLVAGACDSGNDAPVDAGPVSIGDGSVDGPEAAPAGPCACPPRPNQASELPLSCACRTDGSARVEGGGDWTSACSATPQTVKSAACDRGNAVVQITGCGKMALMSSEGFYGSYTIHDAASERLLGFTSYSDVCFGACHDNRSCYSFGDRMLHGQPGQFSDCAPSQVQVCLLCGPPAKLAHGSIITLPSPLPACQ
jgi:hypothetical protein